MAVREIDESKFFSWFDHFKVTYDTETKDDKEFFVRRHVSGHASKKELGDLITKINPSTIIPIHTEKPELFEELLPKKVLIPTYEKLLRFDLGEGLFA